MSQVVSAVVVTLLLSAQTAPAPESAEGEDQATRVPDDATLVYAGSYTRAGKSKGIYLFRLQTRGMEVSQNITLVPLGLAAETPNPSYFELDVKRRLLFAVNEVDKFEGKPGGAVSAFAVDPASGKLKLLNQRASMGANACHLALDPPGRNLLVTNCGGGNVAVLPVAADGKLGAATAVVPHGGGKASPAGAAFAPDGKFAFACDPGLDRVFAYRFDAGTGKLAPASPPSVASKPGAGPRRLVFRPDGRFAYLVNEKSSTITSFGYDAKTGALKELGTVRTVPEQYDGPNTAAELGMHPSGKFVYVSNRGHNSVVLFGVDKDKGTLSFVEEQGTGGKTPRAFGIQPNAKHMAIANQDSDQLLASRIDAGNGRLKPSGLFASVPSPTCVKFLPPKDGE